MEGPQKGNALNKLNPKQVIIPIALGLGVTIYLFVTNYNLSELKQMIAGADYYWVVASILVLIARDAGYIYRLRYLTNKELSWTSCFYSIVLWEFASSISPGIVGGAAIATFVLFKEGLPFGKALAYVMLTAVLDNLFFLVFSGTGLLFFPEYIFPEITGISLKLGSSLPVFFIISCSLILVYTTVMSFGLFFRPRALKWLLMVITSTKYLRRFRRAAYQQGEEIIVASKALSGKDWKYWTRAGLSTTFVWLARYFMLNCLIAAFSPVEAGEHVLILFRQVVMWVIMLISITPGAAGLAEVVFQGFFADFVGNATTAVGVFWRMFTYYPYLLLGALFLPRWFRRVFKKDDLRHAVGAKKKPKKD